MTKALSFFTCVLLSSYVYSGILFDTLVQTPDGLKKIQELNVEDKVISIDKDFLEYSKSILTIEEKSINCYIEIVMENDETLQVSADQRLFVPYKWIQADQLSLGDVLLKDDATFVHVKSICAKQDPCVIYCVTVEDNENLFISKNKVLIHNGVFGATIGFFTAKFLTHVLGHGVIAVIAGAAGLICPPAAYVVGVSLEATFAPFIEATSNVMGLAGGIAGGTATGPV